LASPQEQKDKAKDSGDDDKFLPCTGINDLNAIGNRNVGCNRGLGNGNVGHQVRMGQEFARQ